MIIRLLRTVIGMIMLVNVLQAGDLRVSILNGTQNVPGYADEVAVLDMSAGMAEIASVTAVNGTTTFENINSAPQSQYLVRATLDEVNYSTGFVPDAGVMNWESSVTVYESKDKLSDVLVTVPFFVVYAFEDELYIQKRFQFENHSTPPVTFKDSPGIINVHLPDDAKNIENVTIKYGTMPLRTQVLNHENGQVIPDVLKPGKSEIDLAYYLNYDSQAAEFTEKVYYDIEHFHVYVTPNSMNFSGTGVNREGTDNQNGFAIYNINQVKAGTELNFKISGKGMSESDAQQEQQQSTGRITIEHRLPLNTKLLISAILIVLILIALFISMNQQNSNLEAESIKLLKQQKQTLLKNYDSLSDSAAKASEKDQVLERLFAVYKTLDRIK
ncbi:hypothetical protein HQ531_04150 [bacterium]|nr:hypothetical protein [bacterium]